MSVKQRRGSIAYRMGARRQSISNMNLLSSDHQQRLSTVSDEANHQGLLNSDSYGNGKTPDMNTHGSEKKMGQDLNHDHEKADFPMKPMLKPASPLNGGDTVKTDVSSNEKRSTTCILQ
jgi:hypothetical protein